MHAWIVGARSLAFCLCALALPAQEELYERPRQVLTPQEQETVDYNRKLAQPRKPSPRPPLSPNEAARAKAFREARDSVVFINSITRSHWYENQQGDQFAIPPASGTGFVWDNLGHVVTNHHVITFEEPKAGLPSGEADDLQVTLADGRIYKAVVIGRSLAQDIAVLHVFAPLEAMKPLPIGTSKDLVVGQEVFAIGNPFGLDHTLTSGIVSALGRPIITSFRTHITGAIQTDAAINPGNSGGPLLDRAGRLIGMNTAITSASGASSGIGFAIPVDTLNKLVPVLITKGQTYRPTLGFQTMSNQMATLLHLQKGALVGGVDPGSIAELAGLKGVQLKPGVTTPASPEDFILGDLIIALNGKPVESDIELMDLMELLPPDEPLKLDVLRDGKPAKIILKPGAPPKKDGQKEQKT